MEEKLKQIWPRIKDFFGKMTKKTKRIIAIVIGTILIGAIVFAAIMMSRPYATLFTGLTGEDMSSIITYLNDNGVKNYRVENNDTILVPEAQEPALKASLLQAGYPTSDLGYKMYLDNVNSMTTSTQMRTLYIYDLQDRLAAVIRNFEGVKEAVVDIAVGSDNTFVLNRSAVIEASASVYVEMDSQHNMDNNMAASIRKLVSNSVAGLVIDNVSIHDNRGNTFDGGDGSLSYTDSARLKLALEEQVNNKIRTQVLQVLGPVYGEDNISIGVQSTVDVSRIYQEEVNYTQPDNAVVGNDGIRGIIGSRVYSYSVGRDEDQEAGGVVGTGTNADIPTYVEDGYEVDGQERNLSASGEDQYNVDTLKTQRESASGTVTDVMVSVSINAAQGTVPIEETIAVVARASGITVEQQNDKVALLVRQWPNTEPGEVETPPDYTWVLYAAIAGAILFLLILLVIILLVRRARRKKREAQEAEEAAALAALQAATGVPEVSADIMDIHTERSMELRKDVRRFAESNPEIAALMVKNWLKEDENNG